MPLNGTLDSLNVFLMYLGRNCRWGAPDNCLLKGASLPRCMKDTGMFDKILNSVILKYRHFSGKSVLVSVHLSKLRLPFIL